MRHEMNLAADLGFAGLDDGNVGVMADGLEPEGVASGHTVGAVGVAFVQAVNQICHGFAHVSRQGLAQYDRTFGNDV